jgi:hypothetical protein
MPDFENYRRALEASCELGLVEDVSLLDKGCLQWGSLIGNYSMQRSEDLVLAPCGGHTERTQWPGANLICHFSTVSIFTCTCIMQLI